MNELNILCTTTARAILNESRTYNNVDRLCAMAQIMLPRFMELNYTEPASVDKDQFTYGILPMALQGFINTQEASQHTDESFKSLLAPLAYVSSPYLRERMKELLAEQYIDLPSLDEQHNDDEQDWYVY